MAGPQAPIAMPEVPMIPEANRGFVLVAGLAGCIGHAIGAHP